MKMNEDGTCGCLLHEGHDLQNGSLLMVMMMLMMTTLVLLHLDLLLLLMTIIMTWRCL